MHRFLTPLLLSVLTTVNAGTSEKVPSQKQTPPPVTPFTGVSLGLNTGFIHVSADTRWVNYIPGITYNIGGRYATTANGGYMGVHAIWGRVYPSQFYLGGEVTGAVNFAKGTTRDNINYGLVFRYSLRDSYTAAVRAGIVAGKVLVYAKAGIALTGRKAEVQYVNSTILSAVQSSTKYNLAPMVGIGFDVVIRNRVSCGLESSYTLYPSDRFSYPSAASYNMRAAAYDFKFKVTIKV